MTLDRDDAKAKETGREKAGTPHAEAKGEATKDRLDQALDKALEDSFPGSDPVSVAQPAPVASDKDKHIKRPKPRPSAQHHS